MTLTTYLLLALGGAIGTLARFGCGVLAAPIGHSLPWGTILINIVGSFVIGFFGTLTLAQGKYPISENIRLFVMVGFCGGFTTFSSFSLQTLDMLRGGALARALMNIIISVLLCLAAVGVGHVLASWLNGGRVEIAQVVLEEEA